MFKKGQSGNPKGRPLGSGNLKTRESVLLFQQFHFDALEEKIKLAQSFKKLIKNGKDPEERLEYRRLLLMALKELVKYQYPQLKAIEVSGQIGIEHQFGEIDTLSDAQLHVLIEQIRQKRAESRTDVSPDPETV